MNKKKILCAALAAMMVLSASGCVSAPASGGASAPGTVSEPPKMREATAESPLKIGVVQLVEHPALDLTYEGFVDGLKEAGYEDGKNIKLNFENAQGEQANCATIANKLVSDKSDLILAIATPAAQAVVNLTKTIPVLVTAVTDPAAAKLVATNEAPGANVSGTSDLTPVAEQIDMIKQILPDAKTVGLMYCSSEANSKVQIELAKKECDAQGLKYIEATVSNANEIQQVAQSLVGKVQALYIPTDNMLANGMKTVSMITTPAKLPVIVGESGMVAGGGLVTNGLDYYNLGKQTAAMAVRLIKGEATTATMPIEYLKELSVAYNGKAAAEMGITLPESITATGTDVSK